MSEEESQQQATPEKYSHEPAARRGQQKKRLFPSLSLQRASYDEPASSPYATTQPGFAPPPHADDMPTLPGTYTRGFTPRQVVMIVGGVVLAMIVIFVAVSALQHGGTGSHSANTSSVHKTLTPPPAQQQTATAVAIITNPGSNPSLGTPVAGLPTAATTPGSVATATATNAPAVVPTVPGATATPQPTATPFPIIPPSPNDRWSNINVANAAPVNGYQLSVVVQADIDDCYKAPGQTYCGDYRSQVVLYIPNAASNHGAVHVTHYVANCTSGCPVTGAPIGTWDISGYPYPSNQIDAFTNYTSLNFYKCAYADAVFTQNGQNIARVTTSWQCLNS